MYENKNSDVTIYVACHKPFNNIFAKYNFLKFVEGGASLHANNFLQTTDNTGSNISNKNLSYNELTVLYWAWKNDKISNIMGLCHYRRYFVNDTLQLMNDDTISSLLKKYDIICHKIGPFNTSCKNQISTNLSALRPKDIPVVKDIILKLYGERCAIAFDKILDRNWNYLLNMFISSKTIYNKYCEWLFPILSELEKRINYNELVGQEKRIYGLWGEYLLNVYIEVNNLKVFDCPVRQFDV